MRNRDEMQRFQLESKLETPTPQQMQRARNDFWWGHEQDAAAFEAAQSSDYF